MFNPLRILACCLSLGVAGGALAADPTPAAVQAPLPAAAEQARPAPQQRPRAGTLMRLDRRYAVPTIAHRRADGSLEIRDGGPQPTAAAQAEVHHER